MSDKHPQILRITKLKSVAARGGSARHMFRENPDTENADPHRQKDNINLRPDASTDTKEMVARQQKIYDGLTRTMQKNAVQAVEYLVTANRDFFDQRSPEEGRQYLEDALAFIEKKHGKENVTAAVIHMDETTPHLSVQVVPIDEKGNLNARGFFGGAKKMRALQDDFHRDVGQKHALGRGVKGSKARHVDMQNMYTIAKEQTLVMKETNALRGQEMTELKERADKLEYIKSKGMDAVVKMLESIEVPPRVPLNPETTLDIFAHKPIREKTKQEYLERVSETLDETYGMGADAGIKSLKPQLEHLTQLVIKKIEKEQFADWMGYDKLKELNKDHMMRLKETGQGLLEEQRKDERAKAELVALYTSFKDQLGDRQDGKSVCRDKDLLTDTRRQYGDDSAETRLLETAIAEKYNEPLSAFLERAEEARSSEKREQAIAEELRAKKRRERERDGLGR